MSLAETIRDAPERIVRGFHRTVSPGATRAADEYRVEGGTALHAIAQDTPEGDIQAATQRAAWMSQIARLEDVEAVGGKRSHAQELLLAQLRRNVRQVDQAQALRHATPEALGSQRLAAFGSVGQRQSFLPPIAGVALQPWMLWTAAIVFLGAWGLTQGALKERVENQRDEARLERDAAMRTAQELEAQRDMLAAAARQADQQSQVTADSLRRLEQRRRQEATRARQDQRDIGNILSGVGDPPDVGLREPEPDNANALSGDQHADPQ